MKIRYILIAAMMVCVGASVLIPAQETDAASTGQSYENTVIGISSPSTGNVYRAMMPGQTATLYCNFDWIVFANGTVTYSCGDDSVSFPVSGNRIYHVEYEEGTTNTITFTMPGGEIINFKVKIRPSSSAYYEDWYDEEILEIEEGKYESTLIRTAVVAAIIALIPSLYMVPYCGFRKSSGFEDVME